LSQLVIKRFVVIENARESYFILFKKALQVFALNFLLKSAAIQRPIWSAAVGPRRVRPRAGFAISRREQNTRGLTCFPTIPALNSSTPAGVSDFLRGY